jgi:hypothetical protein
MAALKFSSFPVWLIDSLRPTRDKAEPHYRLPEDVRIWAVPLAIGVALLCISVVGWALDARQFYFSYLVGWTFCLTLALGALFFVMIQHLTRAQWVVAVRRLPEALLWSLPVLALLFIPVLFGLHDLYHWTHHEVYDPSSPEYDPLLAGKRLYLNVPFFLARIAFYFFIWTLLAYKLYTLSVRQDVDPDPAIPAQQRKVSAWGMPLYGVTVAFASYDFLMSLDPHWYSTIFGVYFFAGAFFVALGFITTCYVVLTRTGTLQGVVRMPHFQDLGKLMFGFTAFWAYIAFSQYMLIWYGNIPEETLWYRHRLEHGWEVISQLLIWGHFVLPFLILLPWAFKRTPLLLAAMGIWFAFIHWVDLFWVAMPVLHTEHMRFHWLDVTCWLGLLGVMVGLLFYRLSRHSLVPQNDPYLARSLALH